MAVACLARLRPQALRRGARGIHCAKPGDLAFSVTIRAATARRSEPRYLRRVARACSSGTVLPERRGEDRLCEASSVLARR